VSELADRYIRTVCKVYTDIQREGDTQRARARARDSARARGKERDREDKREREKERARERARTRTRARAQHETHSIMTEERGDRVARAVIRQRLHQPQEGVGYLGGNTGPHAKRFGVEFFPVVEVADHPSSLLLCVCGCVCVCVCVCVFVFCVRVCVCTQERETECACGYVCVT